MERPRGEDRPVVAGASCLRIEQHVRHGLGGRSAKQVRLRAAADTWSSPRARTPSHDRGWPLAGPPATPLACALRPSVLWLAHNKVAGWSINAELRNAHALAGADRGARAQGDHGFNGTTGREATREVRRACGVAASTPSKATTSSPGSDVGGNGAERRHEHASRPAGAALETQRRRCGERRSRRV